MCLPVVSSGSRRTGKNLILFSDDLDKALATFVLANGAAATRTESVDILHLLGIECLEEDTETPDRERYFRKDVRYDASVQFIAAETVQDEYDGLGQQMMRFLMKRKGIDSLESLRSQALAQGVEFIACQMSMDMMGIRREELLDEVTIGGVATYMERADKANVNLFI